MKYINAEKLKTEIEKRARICREIGEREQDENPDMGNYYRGKAVSLEEILLHITSLQQEQPEVDLDAIVDEAFDKYSSVDGYGQLSVSFNRAELYSFIKKIARKEESK